MLTGEEKKTLLGPVTRKSFALVCNLLYDLRLVVGNGGNVAARTEEGSLLVTPSGASLRDMTPETVLEAGLDGTCREGKPSKELSMHLAILKARPDVNAVIHVHGRNIIAICNLFEPGPASLPAISPGFVYYAYPLPVAPFFLPGSPELAEHCRQALSAPDAGALLLRCHGLVAVGAGFATALAVAEEVDETAAIYLATGGKGAVIADEDIPKVR